MVENWVVLLEVAGDADGGEISARAVRDLLRSLDAGSCGGALQSPDRYVVQVTTAASGPAEALTDVVGRWSRVVHEGNLPAWKLVRTEVFTPDELEREFAGSEHAVIGAQRPPYPADGEDDVGRELLRQAFSDPLTGLLTREAFAHRLGAVLDDDPAPGAAAVVWVDIDAFGTINDRLGVATGDEILVSVAERLASAVRPADTLSRLGGDDFGVLLEGTSEQEALAIADRVLEAVRRPLTIGGQTLTPSCSAGIALGRPGGDAAEVLDNAEAALALARVLGGGHPIPYRFDAAQATRSRRELRTAALQDRISHLELVRQAAVVSNEAQTLRSAADALLPQMCAHVGADIGHVWMVPTVHDHAAAAVWYVRGTGPYQGFQDATEETRVQPGVGLAGRVLTTGDPVWISDLEVEADFAAKNAAAACGLRSAFAFPVLVGSEIVAVLEFFSRERMEPAGSFLDVVAGIGIQLGRIVERQRAQQALKRSEFQLWEAHQFASIGSWRKDLRTGTAFMSLQMYEILGWRGSPPTTDQFFAQLVHPEDRSDVEDRYEEVLRTGGVCEVFFRLVRPDGEVRRARGRISADVDSAGRVAAVLGTFQDVTAQRLADPTLTP